MIFAYPARDRQAIVSRASSSSEPQLPHLKQALLPAHDTSPRTNRHYSKPARFSTTRIESRTLKKQRNGTITTMPEERLWKFRKPEWMNSATARSAGVYSAGALVCDLFLNLLEVLFGFGGRYCDGRGVGRRCEAGRLAFHPHLSGLDF